MLLKLISISLATVTKIRVPFSETKYNSFDDVIMINYFHEDKNSAKFQELQRRHDLLSTG